MTDWIFLIPSIPLRELVKVFLHSMYYVYRKNNISAFAWNLDSFVISVRNFIKVLNFKRTIARFDNKKYQLVKFLDTDIIALCIAFLGLDLM